MQCHDVKDAVHPPRYRLLVDVFSADALSKAIKEGRQFLTAEVAFALEKLPVSPGRPARSVCGQVFCTKVVEISRRMNA